MDQQTQAAGSAVPAPRERVPSEGPPRPETFPSRQAREAVRDLLRPRPAIYWADFLCCVALGWCAFALAVLASPFSPGQLVFTAVSALALYRSVICIHELAHRKERSLNSFRLVWNLLCGFPLLTPSFTYHGVHNDHHSRSVYGRKSDGEYVPFALQGRAEIVRYLLLSFALPAVIAGRFLVLAPLSLLHPNVRRLVWERASSLAIDLSYRRRDAAAREARRWRVQEALAFVFGATAIGLIVAGILPAAALLLWYVVAVLIFLLNSLRTLAAHRYRNPEDRELGLREQFLDSVDVPGNLFLTALWAPVGLRYHATHHLFPGIPYHALGEAYRRLTRDAADGAIHREATRRSLWDALARLWRDAGADPVGGAPT